MSKPLVIKLMMIFVLFSLLSSAFVGIAAEAITPADRKREICDLTPEIISHVMTYSPQAQGALASSCRQFKDTAETRIPYQTTLSKNMKLPALLSVPIHADLEVLDGFVAPDTRVGKLSALKFLLQNIIMTISRSPIVSHLKTVFLDEILALGPSLSLQEWKYFGFLRKESNQATSLFYWMVKEFAENERLDVLYELVSTSRVALPSILAPVHLNNVFSSKPVETDRVLAGKLIDYLRDKPTHFRPLLKKINPTTFPILLACNYDLEKLRTILSAGNEINAINEFSGILQSFLMNDYSHLGSDSIFARQLSFIFSMMPRNIEVLHQFMHTSFNQTERAFHLRFDPTSDTAALVSGLNPSIAITVLMLAKKYDEALAIIARNNDIIAIRNFVSDPEFCRRIAETKDQDWIVWAVNVTKIDVWADRSLTAAYYGVTSLEADFSEILEKGINRIHPVNWEEMLPALFEFGSKSDILKYLLNASGVSYTHIFSKLVSSLDSLGVERFKFCFSTLIESKTQSRLEVVRFNDKAIELTFEAAKVIIEDNELMAALNGLEKPMRFFYVKDDFLVALNDSQKFEFMKNHARDFVHLIPTIRDIGLFCKSLLEIARAFRLIGNGISMEQFLGKLIYETLKNTYSWPPLIKGLKYTDQLVVLFSTWKRVNELKGIQQIPEDVSELERQVRRFVGDQNSLGFIRYLEEPQKKAYLSAILLKWEYFNEYAG